jgi:hypothetical protein
MLLPAVGQLRGKPFPEVRRIAALLLLLRRERTRLVAPLPVRMRRAAMAIAAALPLLLIGQAAHADAALDEIFFERQAVELGNEFALVTAVRALLGLEKSPDVKMQRVVHGLWRGIEKRSHWLGVDGELDKGWIDKPLSPDKPAMLVSGRQAFDPILTGLDAVLGLRPAAAAKFAFELRLLPDTFEGLSAEARRQAMIPLRQVAEHVFHDPSLLGGLQLALVLGEPRPALYDEINTIHRQVLGRLDAAATTYEDVKRLRANVFDAGVYLAVAVLAAAQRLDVKLGKGPESVSNLFDQARFYIRSAKLTIKGGSVGELNFPQPPPLTADESGDIKRAVDFLLEIIGHDIGEQLNDLLGRPLVAVFETAIRSQLLVLLYASSGDELDRASWEAMERAARDALLPPELWQDLIEMMKRRVPPEQIKVEVRKFQKRTSAYLRGQ